MTFRQLLKNKKTILLDGAMGTMLQPNYLKAGDIPEILNIINPDIITDIHKKYIQAGSQIIYTNTFGANRKKLPVDLSIKEVIQAALTAAKKATENTNCLIAYDMGPIGELLEPLGSLSFEEAYDIYAEQVKYAKEFGADLIVIETIADLYEMKAAVLAIKENSDLAIIATMTYQETGRTFIGCPVPSMVATLEGLGVDALGINCSLSPDQLLPIVKELTQYASIPITIKANAGLPDSQGNFSADIEKFIDSYDKFIDMGVTIIGGCCGTNPDFIKRLSTYKEQPIKTVAIKPISCVCSGSKFLEIKDCKIIGERLNPTGKQLMKDALINRNFDYIASQAIEQTTAGADILDINCGLPQINESLVMKDVVKFLQSITDAPLQIDSSNPQTIENALRIYNGKAIVNSVNGDNEVLDIILPIVKKYGAAVIGLTLDKNGVPKTQDQRIRIAEKIIQKAKEYGIKQSDIYIDPLTLTVSAEPEQAKITLETLRYIKNVMGYNTVLGVSNVSFGLPNRNLVNASFLTCALNNGLTLPIINPNIKQNIDSIKAFRVINNWDIGCKDYIDSYADKQTNETDVSSTTSPKELDLEYCILNGLKEECSAITKSLLESSNPLDIVNKQLIPALDKVGQLYETGKLFLPQLILSAETAKYGFKEINKVLLASGKSTDKGTILLATVKGDVHDIGKNIVKVVLENYGYNIIDLGKNVDENLVVDTIKKHDIKLVGLSALMTTTALNMELTIKKIKENNLNCAIMVGGAVITSSFAKKIQADFYAKDANDAVKIAKRIFVAPND